MDEPVSAEDAVRMVQCRHVPPDDSRLIAVASLVNPDLACPGATECEKLSRGLFPAWGAAFALGERILNYDLNAGLIPNENLAPNCTMTRLPDSTKIVAGALLRFPTEPKYWAFSASCRTIGSQVVVASPNTSETGVFFFDDDDAFSRECNYANNAECAAEER